MPPSRHPSPDSQAGFTIIETMVACVLLLVGMVATLTIVEQAASTTNKTRAREQGTNLQRELVEAARSVPYDQLTPNGVGAGVRQRTALGDSAVGGQGWTINRRNVTYTVSMGVCTVDDPRDGTGPKEANVFCAEGTPPTPTECASLIEASALGTLPGAGAAVNASLGQCGIDVDLDGTVDGLVSTSATVCLLGTCSSPPDTNPADYKRVVSLVRWPGGHNLQTSQVNSPGLAAAPAVTDLTPDPPLTPDPTAITDTRTSLPLAATASNSPTTMALYLDGTAIGTASPTGGAKWAGSWNLGAMDTDGDLQPDPGETVDGSYQVSAKAFNQYGQYGATRSLTIAVNRRLAYAPARVDVGRNGSNVEIEWSPAKEHDSEGFRVDRKFNNGPWTVVCPLAVQTACRDTNAPAGTLLDPREYKYSVVGFDRTAAGPREGDRSTVKLLDDPGPAAPGAPGPLQATSSNGNVVLTWTAPAFDLLRPAPDHYRIYRDGQGYSDRFDTVYPQGDQPLSYTDTRTTGQVHTYWITAVNSQLRESTMTGPVQK